MCRSQPPSSRPPGRCPTARWAWILLLAVGLCAGCRSQGTAAERVLVPGADSSDGVVFRQFPAGGSIVSLLDVDLRTPGVRVEIAAEPVKTRRGQPVGKSRVVAEWLSTRSAVAGINGGFFGREYAGGLKELVGLLVRNGEVVGPAPPSRSRGGDTRFARSSFGIRPDGTPVIAWASTARGSEEARQHETPELDGDSPTRWPVRAAVGCGPRLIHRGDPLVTDRQERLVSDGALPRTFIGYSVEEGRPRRLVLATATALTFEGCARVLKQYCEEQHGVECREAMALDGGSSTQLAYRAGGKIVEALPGYVTVPSAILVRDIRTAAR